jgi:hypothetical protein
MDSAPVRIVNNITACDEYLIFFESVAFGLGRRKPYCANPMTAARDGGTRLGRLCPDSRIIPELIQV